ncbi:50S ribosomal protein L31 [Candidatus Gottesmanbacteria bacterium RIFCSPLOWO2_01_FULL_46_9]|uniref:Large ribosomal subunit protein bL31 n=1 Tax=Candidatus Gottesmanbacteria bacterium RIFCSPLOWO2_01_FULL_46_9 TaxID=1798394 RepID=A0A1F6AYA8_9BACT|nr:MAG: 50S ribosomal protein L31 [Candidatus Gottesmanbacteria bacterium RIFCSPLOWO2_01_FULL_46_9]
MKAKIHPQWFNDAKVTCSCGHTFTVGATKAEFHVDICSKCHPFFTGEMKFVDTLGRVEKFQQKQKAAAAKAGELAEKKKKKEERVASLRNQKSLKEMLMGVK